MRIILVILVILLFGINFIQAHGEGNFEFANYFNMKQMHSGKIYERMNNLMISDNSDSLKRMYNHMGNIFHNHESGMNSMMNTRNMMNMGMMGGMH
ncbi:hypothetical protein J4221_00820 [Candidatus Pacearchaeota archaeon]|nr:hypothetical protein [Candidatus Pacearchaeota archaeon]